MPDKLSQLERTSSAFRRQLLTHDRVVARELVARYGLVWKNLKARTDALNAQIQEARLAGETVGPSWLFRQNRLGILQIQVEAEINQFARSAATQISGGQSVAVELAQEHARGLVDAQMPASYSVAAQWTRLPSESVNDLVGYLSNGAPLSNLLSTLGPEASKAIGDALITGVALGQGPRAVARLVRDQAGMPLQRALTISRTEQLRSYRTATDRSYLANADVLDGWYWHSALSNRSCMSCIAMHGTYHKLEETLDEHVCGRCTKVPKTKSWEQLLGEKGKGIEETSITMENGTDWFARQSPEVQLAQMGPKKFALYRDGQIQLSDLVTPTRSKVWGPGLRESNIAEALEKAGARGTPLAVISEQGIDDMVKDGATLMYRGVKGDMSHDAQYYVDKLLSGEHSGNKSLYGTGLFVATGDGALSTATMYAGENGIVLKGAISKTAKIITDPAARAAITAEKQLLDSDLSATVTRLAGVGTSKSRSQIGEAIIEHGKLQNKFDAYVKDPTQWAKDRGYDAVRQRTAGTMSEELVILNTRVVNIAEAMAKAGARESGAAISLSKRLAGVEQQIRGNATETAYIFDSTGKQLLRKAGTESQLSFTPHELDLMNSNILTHNHPRDYNFSQTDIEMALEYKLREIRAVGQEYTHSMGFPGGHALKLADVEDSFGQLRQEATLRYRSRVRAGEMSPDEAEVNVWHDTWGELAKRYGWTYERRAQ